MSNLSLPNYAISNMQQNMMVFTKYVAMEWRLSMSETWKYRGDLGRGNVRR